MKIGDTIKPLVVPATTSNSPILSFESHDTISNLYLAVLASSTISKSQLLTAFFSKIYGFSTSNLEVPDTSFLFSLKSSTLETHDRTSISMSLDHFLVACPDLQSYQRWEFLMSHNEKNIDPIINFDCNTIFRVYACPFNMKYKNYM